MPRKRVERGVESKGGGSQRLSLQQREILSMITNDFLTVKQVATARQTSIAATYKTLAKLKKKGYLTKGLNKGLKNQTPLTAPTIIKDGMIRLHGQQWRITILMGTEQADKYLKLREQGNVLHIDGNTVELNLDSVEVYGASDAGGGSDIGFFGEDVQRATSLSFEYWNRFFFRLENELGIIFMKDRANNKKLVHTGHYAEVGNELAKDYNEKKVKLNIYGLDDGKLWFKIDNSFNLHEAETVHPGKSEPDMERVKAVFNEYRDDKMPLPSEVLVIMKKQAENVNEIAAGLNVMIKLNTPKPEPKEEDKLVGKPYYVG